MRRHNHLPIARTGQMEPQIPRYSATLWALLLGLSWMPKPAAAQTGGCQLTGVRMAQAADGAQTLSLLGNCTPHYSVLRLRNPSRIVIDIADTQLSLPRGSLPVAQGNVAQVSIRPIHGPKGALGRVIVALKEDAPYAVAAEGQDLILRLQPSPTQVAIAAGSAAAHTQLPATQTDAVATQTPAPAMPAAQTPAAEPFIQPHRHAEAQPKLSQTPARKVNTLRGLRPEAAGVLLQLGGPVQYETTLLQHPPRLVVDLPQTRSRKRAHLLKKRPAWVRRVRMANKGDGVRLVFDLREGGHASVAVHPQGLLVTPKTARTEVSEAKVISEVRFEQQRRQGRAESRIFVRMPAGGKPSLDVHSARAWVLAIDNAILPAHLERSLDTSASASAVALVSSFQAQAKPPRVHIVLSLTAAAQQRLERLDDGWLWIITDKEANHDVHVSSAIARAGGYASPTPHTDKRLAQHRISLDVKDAELVNVLRLISEETGENIIASDEVHGKVTLKLRDVPAEQALDTILRIKGFDRVRQNNILRIASAETIQKERDLEVSRKRALIEVEEVIIKMVTINYANATEIIDQLKPMLSGRGSVQVDSRTNTLIVQDVASNIERLVELTRRLDKQTPLVNIQARIVEADSTFVRDLGVQWGGAVQHTARTGNPTGLYFPADVIASGAADATIGNAVQGTASPARYAVNLPATLSGSGAGLGFILGSAGGAQLLDLRLSAMETNGNGKIISSPEVSTLDNRTARVSQGVEIPVSVVSAAGTNTRFVPAVLELEVTPHVTNDGTVLLKIHVQKSAPDFSNRGGQGDPSIKKKQAETEVLVKDGDTSVIGGILTRETAESRSQVPFLSRIPILGHLFREHSSRDTRSELLVFITPRIINREESKLMADSVVQNNK